MGNECDSALTMREIRCMVSLLLIGQNVKRQLRVKLAEGEDRCQHHHHLG